MLNHLIKITVPSTSNVSNPDQALATKWVDAALTMLATLFGGATALPGVGSYMADNGQLIKENVTVVYSYTNDDGMRNSRNKVIEFALNMGKAMGQECIMVEIDNVATLINTRAAQVA